MNTMEHVKQRSPSWSFSLSPCSYSPWVLYKLLFPQAMKQGEDLLFKLLEENAHIHPPLGVKDADLENNS